MLSFLHNKRSLYASCGCNGCKHNRGGTEDVLELLEEIYGCAKELNFNKEVIIFIED